MDEESPQVGAILSWERSDERSSVCCKKLGFVAKRADGIQVSSHVILGAEAAASCLDLPKLWPENRQSGILESIFSLQLRLSDAAKLESRGAGGAALENGDEHRVSKECCDGETVEQRLSNILRAAGAAGFIFKSVPSDYYERTYEERRDLLGAASVDHLCKSIVMGTRDKIEFRHSLIQELSAR